MSKQNAEYVLSNFETEHDLLKKDVDEDDQLVFVSGGLCFKCQIVSKTLMMEQNAWICFLAFPTKSLYPTNCLLSTSFP